MSKHLDSFEWLRRCYRFAARWSTDPRTQTAAALVGPDQKILLFAANKFPSGVRMSPERLERPLKYEFFEHAERRAIFEAARRGIPTEGCTLVCPWFACAPCARAIIEAGITKVVGHDHPVFDTHKAWKETITLADQMLAEAGVETLRVTGEMGAKLLFDGKIIQV